MINASKFQRYNGHIPTVTKDPVTARYTAETVCNCGTGPVVISVSAPTERNVLEALLRGVLSEHGRIVMERAGWKCSACGRIAPLQADHIIPRSHGRDDRVTNLRALDDPCHRRRHGEKVHPLDIGGSRAPQRV